MSTLDELQNVLGLTADAQSRETIETKLIAPDAPLIQFIEGVRTQAEDFTNCRHSFDGTVQEWKNIEKAWSTEIVTHQNQKAVWTWLPFFIVNIINGIGIIWASNHFLGSWTGSSLPGIVATIFVSLWLVIWLSYRYQLKIHPTGTIIEAIVGCVFVGSLATLFSLPFRLFHFTEFLFDFFPLIGMMFGAWLGIDRGFGLRAKIILQEQTIKQIVVRILFFPFATLGLWSGCAIFFYNIDNRVSFSWVFMLMAMIFIFSTFEGITEERFPIGTLRELTIGLLLSLMSAFISALSVAWILWYSGYNPISWFIMAFVYFSWSHMTSCYHRGLNAGLTDMGDSLALSLSAALGALAGVTVWSTTFGLISNLLPMLGDGMFLVLLAEMALAIYLCKKYAAPRVGYLLRTSIVEKWIVKPVIVDTSEQVPSRRAAFARGIAPVSLLRELSGEIWFSIKDWFMEKPLAQQIISWST